MQHSASVITSSFQAIVQGIKRFEIFPASSQIQKGDTIHLQEFAADQQNQLKPTGKQVSMLAGFVSGVGAEHIVVSLLPVPENANAPVAPANSSRAARRAAKSAENKGGAKSGNKRK